MAKGKILRDGYRPQVRGVDYVDAVREISKGQGVPSMPSLIILKRGSKAKKGKRKKLKKIGVLKRKVWKVFSEWVRQLHTGPGGMAACVTCRTTDHWKNLHAGHFIHGHSKATFLDERNVHPQCPRCNHFLSGNLIEYSDFMRKTYGQDTIDDLREMSHQIWKPTRDDLNALIEMYTKKISNLEV